MMPEGKPPDPSSNSKTSQLAHKSLDVNILNINLHEARNRFKPENFNLSLADKDYFHNILRHNTYYYQDPTYKDSKTKVCRTYYFGNKEEVQETFSSIDKTKMTNDVRIKAGVMLDKNWRCIRRK